MLLKQEANKSSKDKILASAAKLFNYYGFNGTSVRDIASEAGVNVSLVAYHFGGKQSLLEKLMSYFMEGYINTLETTINEEIEKRDATDLLTYCAEKVLRYQKENAHSARFVQREMTMDSMLTREIMNTYLMKEKYLLHLLFEALRKETQLTVSVDLLILQYRDLLIMPFLQAQYIREVYFTKADDDYFIRRYIKVINQWVQHFTLKPCPPWPKPRDVPGASNFL